VKAVITRHQASCLVPKVPATRDPGRVGDVLRPMVENERSVGGHSGGDADRQGQRSQDGTPRNPGTTAAADDQTYESEGHGDDQGGRPLQEGCRCRPLEALEPSPRGSARWVLSAWRRP
jgi:hypothetical protein